MTKPHIEDYSKIESKKNVKHIVDSEGNGWFCYCGSSAKTAKPKSQCCSSESSLQFERVG
jgi:hypothetical protein